MVVFLTSIRHPQNSNNFEKVEDLFETTLHSVFSQRDPNFKFVVVCNQIPNVKFNDPKLVYHVVDFPPQSPERKTPTGMSAHYYDKGTKLMSGLLFSLKFYPDYIFIIDADDWVNIRVVEYLHTRPKYPVWYVDGGYLANYKLKRMKRKHGMNRFCGSTFAYEPSFLIKMANIAFHIDETSAQEQLIAATSENFIYKNIGDHPGNYRFFSERGIPPKPFAIRAISWVTETGENYVGMSGDRYGLPIDRRFCDNFGLSYTFISSERATLALRIRETLSCVLSKMGWIRSKISANNGC